MAVLAVLAYVVLSMLFASLDAELRSVQENRLVEAKTALHKAADETIAQCDFTRDHHRVYTVDLAQLAIYAALAEDRAMFDTLRDLLLRNVVMDAPDDPLIHGMVAWGYTATPGDATQRSEPHDASGTTEALRVAEALTLGIDAFGHDDQQVVRDILDAYARHAVTEPPENGTWYIRNYFNLGTRAFATNCFLIDLDPDLVFHLADRLQNDTLHELADRKAGLIEQCRVASRGGHGLLHQMIRPEVATAMGPSYVIYSANGHEQLNLTLTVAERCVTTNPDAARAAFDFAMARLGDLQLTYNTDTGRPAHGDDTPRAGPETFAPLLRLAVRLEQREAVNEILPHLCRVAADLPESTHPAKLYALGETLWALEVARKFRDDSPSAQ